MAESTDFVTRLVAWIGASTGVASLAWNIYLKMSSGPKITLLVRPGIKLFPPAPANPSYIGITVRNTGTETTTLTNIAFHVYPSRRAKRKRESTDRWVVDLLMGQQLPHTLTVGDEWTSTVPQSEQVSGPIADGTLWCELYHSFGKPIQVKVVR
jgi:hypothetical protein